MKRGLLVGFALALTACGGDPVEAIAKAERATGDALAGYSRNISNTVDLAGDAALVQRFCQNALGAECPADVVEQLEAHGYLAGGTGVDLAHAFVVWVADAADGEADLASSDEDYFTAAYKVVVAREPDSNGAPSNLTFIKDGGARKTMLRGMLESDEFKRLN